MRVQLLPSPANASTARVRVRVGWSNVRKFLAQGNTNYWCCLTLQLYSWVNWSNVGKVLAQGKIRKFRFLASCVTTKLFSKNSHVHGITTEYHVIKLIKPAIGRGSRLRVADWFEDD